MALMAAGTWVRRTPAALRGGTAPFHDTRAPARSRFVTAGCASFFVSKKAPATNGSSFLAGLRDKEIKFPVKLSSAADSDPSSQIRVRAMLGAASWEGSP